MQLWDIKCKNLDDDESGLLSNSYKYVSRSRYHLVIIVAFGFFHFHSQIL